MRSFFFRYGSTVGRGFVGVLLLSVVQAATAIELLPPKLMDQINNHGRVLASIEEVSMAEQARTTAYAGYLPTISATLMHGREKIINADDSESMMSISEWGATLAQSIYDFGMTEAQVDAAELGIVRSREMLRLTYVNLLMEGISAYLNLEKSTGRVNYALQSEQNIMQQTGVEESMVEAGTGVSSDVLQTKAQLAGTQAIRVQEEGGQRLAEDRYWAVFGSAPDEEAQFLIPDPVGLPANIEEALKLAGRYNPEIIIGMLDVQIARETVRAQRATGLPKLTFNMDYKESTNVGGSAGTKKNAVAKVQLNVPIYDGNLNKSTVQSALHGENAAQLRLSDTRKRIHESVRTAWHNWKTAKDVAAILNNQAVIALEFLAQAREERKLGTRTLQEVLAGETSYLGAISNAVSAEIDHRIAAYQLLNTVGLLGNRRDS